LPIWTSDDLFPLKGEVPKSITIVGGGFIAVELANFFDAVGVQTTVMVLDDRLLPAEDKTISTIFAETHSCEALLYAIGRQLNVDSIGLEHTTIALNDRGGIVRDDYLQTSVSGIYALGDVATRYQLQHIATFEANAEWADLRGRHRRLDAERQSVVQQVELSANQTYCRFLLIRNPGLSSNRARIVDNDS